MIGEMAKVLDQQALARGLAEIQFRLNGFGPKIAKSDAGKLGTELQSYVAGIDVAATVTRCRELFEEAVAANDYQATLRLYNCKGVIAFVATSLGIKKEVYCRMVLDLVRTEPDGPVAKSMRKAVEVTPDPAVVMESTESIRASATLQTIASVGATQ